MWREVMGDEFIRVPRLSRIYYRGKFYDYPLKLANALGNIGPYEAGRIMLSYLKWRVRPSKTEDSFEEWGDQPLRGAALHALLPLLHAEGVGHPAAPDPGRLGGAAHQEPVAHEGGVERDLGLQRHRVLDRGVRLPAAGAWADVGARGRGGAGAGRRGAPRDARGAPGARGARASWRSRWRARPRARARARFRAWARGAPSAASGCATPRAGPPRARAWARGSARWRGPPRPPPRPPPLPAPGRRARARASRPGTSSTPWG